MPKSIKGTQSISIYTYISAISLSVIFSYMPDTYEVLVYSRTDRGLELVAVLVFAVDTLQNAGLQRRLL